MRVRSRHGERRGLGAIWVLVWAVCLITFPKLARASQTAIVTHSGVRVYQSPDDGSEELARYEQGTRIRVSSLNKRGWFKVKVDESRYGWINGSDLALENVRGDLNAAGVQILQPQTRQRGFSRWDF